MSDSIKTSVAEKLLQIEAVKLSPENPFTWASGLKSPIYCDNRKILSYPEIRNYVTDAFAKLVKEKYPNAEVIAGVATGAIAIGVLIADALNLPFIYVRPEAKKHGLGNKIEGVVKPNQKVVIIEDLISTGMSSLKAYDALIENGNTVLGMCAIFTYDLPISHQNFNNTDCELTTLTDFNILAEFAMNSSSISKGNYDILMSWKENFNK